MAKPLSLAYTPSEPAARAFWQSLAQHKALLGPIEDGRNHVVARCAFRLAMLPGAGRVLIIAPDRDTRDEHTAPGFLQALPGGAQRDGKGQWQPRLGRWDAGARRYEFAGIDPRGREIDAVVQFLAANSGEDRKRLDSAASAVWLDDAHRLDVQLYEQAAQQGRTVLLSGAMPAADHWLAQAEDVERFYREGEVFGPAVASGAAGETIAERQARYLGYLQAAFGDDVRASVEYG